MAQFPDAAATEKDKCHPLSQLACSRARVRRPVCSARTADARLDRRAKSDRGNCPGVAARQSSHPPHGNSLRQRLRHLTLREITRIREAIIGTLTAIYHARIEYPGFNPPLVTGPLSALPSGEIDSEEHGITYNKASDVPINEAGEVEDEAISRTVVKR